jgi:signal transduction histidine kinase/ActR/RegA family two-component response regulator
VSHFETQRCHKDGHLIAVSVSAAPIRDAQGAIVGAAKIARDITERKRIEAELARANRAKGEFLANMSHEIRTPLNAILGLTQILERDTLAPDQQDLLHKISEAGSSLLHIINDILDFSKIEAGQFQIDPAPFGLDALLTRLENLLTATAQQKGLTLAVRSPDGFSGQLVGDSLRIEQVLTNLIGNAIKFTEQGRVEVSVTPLAVTEQTVRLRFAVTDTGVGITPEQREKLFQPFSQADASTTRRFGGTGLGLSISKRLVELMGGTIGVTSTPGQGSTFWFELPLCPAAMATACQQPMPSSTEQGPRLTGLRVLAVDDVRINLFMLQRALQLEGATVSLAADGLQALDTLRASPAAFDVVLMDIQMPVMDGLTATRTLREDPTFAELPIIALTAGVMAEERAAAQTAGMTDFLAKPLDLKQMVAVLLPYVPTGPGSDSIA